MKRVISFLLAVTMLLSVNPISAITTFAADKLTATINIESVSAAQDSYVDVAIDISKNPGIASMGLTLSFDEDLTLVGATNGEAFAELTMTPPAQLKKQGSVVGSCRFAWLGNDNCTEIGTILNLRFQVSADATLYKDCQVTIACDVGDVLDNARNPIEVTANNGKVTIIDYIPGDVDGSGYINMLDVLTLCQYYVDGCKYDPDGYAINIKAESGDVDASGKINMLDTLTICQYYVDGCKYDPNGYGVKLLPGKRACNHEMQHFDSKAVTCTEDGNIEYWYCDLCKDYFADAEGKDFITYDYAIIKSNGHNSITFDAVPATPTTEGYTAGVWCDKCETWTFGHEIIPPIAPNESNVSYRHYVQRENANGNIEIVNDEYLSTHEIINPNPVTYVEGEGIAELIEGVEIDGKKVSANGYSFLGWYEKPEATANRVYSISSDATGNKVLYGVWSKNEYKITYLPDSASSTLPRVEDGSYTVDKETSLKEPPKWPNLVWIGWSDEDGNIVKSIPKGTTGDISLTANWMSKRSQTVPNTKYSTSTPAITVDEAKGIYAFAYEIGEIQNVPIQQVEEGAEGKGFNLVKGMTHEINKTFTQKIGVGEATSVADTIANATTKSDSWTLAEDWNKSTSFSQEHSNEVTQEQSQKAAMSFSETGKYSISAGVGGTKEHIDETGTSTKTTKKHELGVNYEIGSSVNVGAKADLKAGVTKGTPFKNASVDAGVSVDQKFGLDYKYSTETEKETYEKHTDKSSSYWNVNEGFENSQTLSQTAEFAQSLSQSIKDTYKYGETLDFGGSSSNTVSSSNTSSESREYASSVTYSTEEGKSVTVVETLTADAETGFYRKVLAANFKVFAVVIYDMKSNTFSTMTHSLKINDSEHLFTDYSTVSSFNDYENGVLPFDVPAFVGDYVYGLVGASEGLRFDDETGVIEGYGFKDPITGICYKEYDEFTDTYSNPCDTDVIIPRYVVITIGGNQKKIVPVTGIAATAFSGTNVTSVYLSDKITVIPDGAFENCTALKYVRGGAINTIGKNAFKNCNSLFEFDLPESVVNLGNSAFEGVKALSVNVSNLSVLDATLTSGVERLSINLEKISGTIDGKKIVTPENIEYFYLSGGGRTFSNLSIESDAATVIINNIIINNYVDVPLKLTSENVELGFTTINSNSLLMRLDADNTNITLDGNNYLISSGDNAVLSKNVRFIEKEGSSASGKLRVAGNVLVFGTANGIQRVSFESAEHNFVYLTQEEYENMLNSHFVRFDANGGTVSMDNKLVMWNSTIGELPIPTRANCTFLGWFREDGTQVTEDTIFNDLNDITVRAYWQSDWVLASEIPTDGSILNSKWTYNLTSKKTHTSPTLSGWTLYDTKRTSWGATVGPVYSDPSNGSRNVWNERYVSSTTTHYTFYHRYGWGYNTGTGTNGYVWGSDSQLGSGARHEIDLTWDLAQTSNLAGNACWKGYACPQCGASNIWFGRSTYVENHYSTRWYYQEPVYTYYFTKTEAKESTTEISASDTVSNVQKWVQYVVK